MALHSTARLCLATLLCCAGLAGANAQDFPTRPITVMVGLAPGGITDVTARLYADVVSRNIGQRLIVENRPTAAGAAAAAAVQNAQPDGYTVLIFSGSQHATVAAQQSVPYDPVKGFAPVTMLFRIVTLLVVPADSPANSVAELLGLGRSKPGGLSFGSPGVGTPSHLLAAKIAAATKTPMQYVQYRGGAPVIADLVTGRVDFSLLSYTGSGSQLKEGKLKALAIDADARWGALPNVPTLTEAGLGQERVANWFGLAAPARTPAPIVQKLREEFIKASQDPELMRRLADNGTPIATSTSEAMGIAMAEEAAAMEVLVKTLGLRQQ